MGRQRNFIDLPSIVRDIPVVWINKFDKVSVYLLLLFTKFDMYK